MKAWMIYGANGFIGRLIVEECVRRGYLPILAGRDDEALMELADAADLEYRVFDLQHQKRIKDQVADVTLVLNCAGPFNETAAPLRQAALATACHYIDLCAEYDVNAQTLNLFPKAREKGCVLLAGSGFYSVAADVLVATMHAENAELDSLILHYSVQPFFSVGAVKSFISMMQQGLLTTNNMQMAFTLADGLACRHSSGIEHSETRVDEGGVKLKIPLLRIIQPLLKFTFIRAFVLKKMQKNLQENIYAKSQSDQITVTAQLQTLACDKNVVEKHITVAEPYAYTVTSCLMAVTHVLADKVMPGAFSAAEILDHDAVMFLGEDAQADSEEIIELDFGE